MIITRTPRRTDEKQLLNLAIDFFKKNQRGKIASKELLPLIQYKNYDKHLREDVRKYMNINKNNAAIFVAEDKGTLIGYIYGQIVSKPKMKLGRIGVIEDWFVEEKYRGRMIGEMLWDKLMTWFRDKKCNRLELDVYPTNNKAIKIYHRMGFVDKAVVMTRKIKH